MAQQVKLRRSSVAGNKPTTSQLELGELAINTNDGKLYFEKSSSLGESVQEIIVTGTWNTGSINISGSVTISGSIIANSFTGSLLGTASYANSALSASYTLTASYFSGSIPLATTSSYSITASYALAVSGSGVVGDISGNATNITAFTIDQDLGVSDQVSFGGVTASFLGNLTGTASYASNALSASYSLTSISASYALSASYAATSSYAKNIVISGSINNVDYIDFNTGSATPAWKNGRIFWDNTEGALSVYNSEADVTLQVGQENWTRVFNDTGIAIANGAAVRIIGTHGDHPEVVLAASIQVSGSSNLVNQVLGLATHTIEDGTFGYVTTQGLVRGLNTSAYNDGDTLYVSSSAGQLTAIVPSAPYEIIPVGQVVKASPGGSGIIYVAVQQPLDFSDLSSVLVTGSYSYGDLWTYIPSGSFGVWSHQKQLSGSYGVTGSWSATSFTGSLLGTASYVATASYIPTLQQVTNQGSTTTTAITSSGLYVNGNAIISGNLNVLGTASFANVTSSVVIVGDNTIILNTDAPSVRYGGIEVIDSGSFGNSSTGSLLWDSEKNRWIYSNPSGSTYDGGLIMSGPRNTSGLGNEEGTTLNAILKGQGGDHLTSSAIIENGTSTDFYSGAAIITSAGSVTATSFTGSLLGTASYASNALSSSYALLATTASYFSGSLFAPGSTTQILYNNGGAIAGDSGLVYSGSRVGIGVTNPGKKLDVVGTGETSIRVRDTGGASLEFYQQATGSYILATNNISLYTNGSDRLRITSAGDVGIGSTVPSYKLDVIGTGRFSSNLTSNGYIFSTNQVIANNSITSPTTDNTLTNGTVYALNGISTTNNYGLGLASVRNSKYDIWFQTGTANGGGYRWYIGTTEKMTVDYLGNVGIGTTSPSNTLQVVGGVTATSFTGSLFGTSSYATQALSSSFATTAISASYFSGSVSNAISSSYATTASFATTALSASYFSGSLAAPGSTTQILYNNGGAIAGDSGLVYSGSNVGIGTVSPDRGLTINKSGGLAALNIIKNNTGNQIAYLGTGTSAGDDAGILQLSDLGTVKAQIFTAGNSYFNGGNVGIGTTSPSEKLEVVGNINLSSNGGYFLNGALTLFPYANDTYIRPYTTSGNINFQNYSGAEAMRITSAGNVGIGTTNPGQKLQVEGSLLVNAGTSATSYRDIMIGGIGGWDNGESHGIDTVYNTASSPTTFSRIESYYDGTNGKIRFRNLYNAGAPRTDILMTIQGNGNVGIGTDSPADKLYVSSSGFNVSTFDSSYGQMAISFANNGTIFSQLGSGNSVTPTGAANDLGLGTAGLANNIIFATGTSYLERMRITSGGNVGIGSTSPSDKLEVVASTYNGITITTPDVTTLKLRSSGGGTKNWGFATTNLAASDFGIYESTSAGGDPINAGTARLYFKTGGTVGIGTTNTTQYSSLFPAQLVVNAGSAVDGIFSTTNDSSAAELVLFKKNPTNGFGSLLIQHSGSSGRAIELNYGVNMSTGVGGTTSYFVNTNGSGYYAGNVGIGTTSPSAKLEILGNDDQIILNTVGTYSSIYFRNNGTSVGQLFSTNAATYLTTIGSRILYLGGGNGVTQITLDGTNVGIGTGSPVTKLQVVGGYISTKDNAAYGGAFLEGGNGISYFGSLGSDDIELYTGGATKVTIKQSTGNVGIGTTGPGAKLDIVSTGAGSEGLRVDGTGGGFAFVVKGGSDYTSHIRAGATIGVNYFTTPPSNGLIVEGNVGIGTTNPGYKLDVNGNTNITGNLFFNSNSTLQAARKYVSTATLSNAGYTVIGTVTGDALASSIRISLQGTANGTVINVLADILVNHYQDILITSQAGIYTILTLRVTSDNNALYSIEATTNSSEPCTTYVEIFPLNSETVVFGGSAQSGEILTHACTPGMNMSSTGGSNANLAISGDMTIGSSLISNQNISPLSSGAQVISANATGSYTAAFYNYTVASGSNARAGQVSAVWNGASIQYTDVSTTDIGSTLGVAFTASLSGANVRLTTVIPTSGWTVKTLVNLI